MFLAELAGLSGFKRADGFGNVAGERDADGAGFLGDGEVGFARQVVIDLEKIVAAAGQEIDGVAGLIGGGDGEGAGRDVAGGEHQRAVEESGGDDTRDIGAGAPLLDHREGDAGEHFAHAGDAVGHQHREKGVGQTQVHVHVPESGDEKFAAGIDDLRAGRDFDFFPDGENASAGDDHGDVLKRLGRDEIDDRGALDEDGLGWERG